MSGARHYYRPGSRLWLALRFSELPLEVLGVDASTETAMVVAEKQIVIYVNESAYKVGVRYGMDVTTAKLLSNCEVYQRDEEKEAKALQDLSAQLYQFTPYIEPYKSEWVTQAGLLLEVSTCLQLFSGIHLLTEKIFTYLHNTHYRFCYGYAHTSQGAWLLSFEQYFISGNENKELFCERLKKLPIQLLHDFPQEVEALEKTGFTNFGDITRQLDAQKITSIKKRWGAQFAQAICDIFAIEQNLQQKSLFDKPRLIYKPVEFFSENIQFDYPINQTDQLHYPIEHLLQNLSQYLRKRQLQCQYIQWIFSDIYHNHFALPVRSDTAESHWELLYDLTLIQLDNRELPFEVDSLTLKCQSAMPLQNRSQSLAFGKRSNSRESARSFAITMAKLKARLGDDAVFKLSYQDAILPESSNQKILLTETANQQLPALHKGALRPHWLLPTPALIEIRKRGLYWRGHLTLLAGPERIRATWWEKPEARDYFIAQRHDHVRLWIFLDLHKKDWFVHGIFG